MNTDEMQVAWLKRCQPSSRPVDICLLCRREIFDFRTRVRTYQKEGFLLLTPSTRLGRCKMTFVTFFIITMAHEPDDLYTLRAQFWLGHYDLCLEEAKAIARRPMAPHLKQEREEFVSRAHLGIGTA